MPKRGDNFQRAGHVPSLGDVAHLNWSPQASHEMAGPQYGLVLSADLLNQATGLVVVAPVTSKGGKVSGFELPVKAGRVSGVVMLSGLRSLDYQSRDIRYECKADPALAFEATRRIKMVFPSE